MVNAGRILIIAKGTWSSLVTYEQLDLVSKDGVAYLARQASVGQDPSTDTSMTYWQPFGSVSDIATTSKPGLVMPDGTTITIDQTGLIRANLGISDINDVVIATIADGDILQYDSATQKWKNTSINALMQAVEGMIAPLENGSTTSQAYAVGQKFIRNNVLYKAKVAIASGASFASLVLNTDYEVAESVSEQDYNMSQLVGKRLTAQTLAAGSTSLTFSDSSITSDSTILVRSSIYGVVPTAITPTTGQVVLTFNVQPDDVSVYIVVC